LSDVRVFAKSDGLTWIDSAGRTFTLDAKELREWMGDRAQAGRMAPKGFPRSNKFGPAFPRAC
jgi:topoisomerase-4 subunit A